MILKLFAWLRLIIAIAILYYFAYNCLFHKYYRIINDYDKFFTKITSPSNQNISQIFNFTIKQISVQGKQFTQCHQRKQLSKQIKNQGKKSLIGQFSNILSQLNQVNSLRNNYWQKISNLITPNKIVHKYLFNFYNWYRFQLNFHDIGIESYLQFRLTQQNQGSHSIMQKISFKLPQNFFPHSSQNSFTKDKLNIQLKTLGLQLNVSQITLNSSFGDQFSDGLQMEKYFALTKDKVQTTKQDFQKFGSKKTLTLFNFKLMRKDYEIKANLSHVIRHNQCFSSLENNLLRHKCMGGYGRGKLNFYYFVKKEFDGINNNYQGTWQRQTFNLDNARTRTTFIGYEIFNNYLSHHMPQFNKQFNTPVRKGLFSHNYIQIDFIGFSKAEYYSKHDNIQKQRWVGMTLFAQLQQSGKPRCKSTQQNYLYVNGNIHPINDINFVLPLNMKNGMTIQFQQTNPNNIEIQNSSGFKINFLILNSTLLQEQQFLNNRKTYIVDGFWSGWVDQQHLQYQSLNNTVSRKMNNSQKQLNLQQQKQNFQYVEFYNITGTIKIVQESY